MDFFATEAICRPETADRRDHFFLQALPALEIALVRGEVDEELTHERAYGSIPFRGLDARSPVDVIR